MEWPLGVISASMASSPFCHEPFFIRAPHHGIMPGRRERLMVVKTIQTRIMFLALAALVTSEVAIQGLTSESVPSPLFILGVGRVVQVVILLVIVSIWGTGSSSLGLARGRIVTGVARGLIWAGIFGACACVGFAVLYATDINPWKLIKNPLPPTTEGVVLFFVVGGLIAPIAEEVFFRGIVYGFLRRWGVVLALTGTTVLFVLAHAATSRIPLTQIVGGIVFAVAYEVEGNLMVPITIHVLGNMAIFALSLAS
jgi:membrane protease YdiL (CAAX protease family)